MPKRYPESMERMLDLNRDQVTRHVSSLREVQNALKEVVGDRSLLVVDTLSGGARAFREGVEKLQQRGGAYEDLAKIYLQKIFGGKLPGTIVDVMKNFLGESLDVVGHDIRETRSQTEKKISAALFTGSPADVTKAFSAEFADREIRKGAGITHSEVFRRTQELYNDAARDDIPVIGICYGHQVMTKARGGEVVRLPGRSETGLSSVESGSHTDFLAGVFPERGAMKGRIAAYHNEEVVPNTSQSAIILRASDVEPEMVHGLIHIGGGAFKGDLKTDAALVRSLLSDSKHVGLSVQGHPEETGAERVVTFALTEDAKIFEETEGRILTADMLAMFTKFLEMHGEFAKKR